MSGDSCGPTRSRGPLGVFKPSVNLPAATQAAADPALSEHMHEDMRHATEPAAGR